jgi:hypothetical protein
LEVGSAGIAWDMAADDINNNIIPVKKVKTVLDEKRLWVKIVFIDLDYIV